MGAGRTEGVVGTGSSPEDLMVLGAVGAALAPDDLGRSLDAVAEELRAAARADDCEIFLCEPHGGDAVLTACCGSDRDALMERVRFPPGVGYPGLVCATGEPLLTRRLDRDPRFLRRRVTERGIVSFVTAPLWGSREPLGCMSLAWRSGTAPSEQGAELLSKTAPLVATGVRAGLLAARELIGRAIDGAEPALEARGLACLHVMMSAAGARAGTLALYDPSGGETTVLSWPAGVHVCICASAVDGRARCPMLEGGHGVVLAGARSDWPAECRCLPTTALSPVCLPLRSDRRLRGVVVLDRGGAPPNPSTRDLVALLSMTAEAAVRLAPRSQAEPSSHGSASHAAGPVLDLRCFGGFDVRVHGALVPAEAFSRRKALTLLKLLILNAGNPISRDALADRLWPGADAKSGANRLHGVLHALRRAIEPFREQQRWIYICNVGELYYFNMESPHWIDVYAFRRHAADAHESERRHRPEEAIRHLEAALELYRGELFADEPYAAWCELERAEFKHQYMHLTGRLADLLIGAGEVERAVGWLWRGLLADPLREDLHQKLMRALMALGQRHQAQLQYQTCVNLLRDELGVEPLPETRRLAQLAAAAVPDGRSPTSPTPSL